VSRLLGGSGHFATGQTRLRLLTLCASSGVLLLALIVTLYIFHRRRTKRDNQEWTKDPQELDDYGMGAMRAVKAGHVQPPPVAHHHDRPNKETEGMGLGVPHNRISIDSTHSLARQLRGHDDNLHSAAQVPRSLV
jgi:hypothetical protein